MIEQDVLIVEAKDEIVQTTKDRSVAVEIKENLLHGLGYRLSEPENRHGRRFHFRDGTFSVDFLILET